jgi:mRNA interferase RelE/StbE
MALYNIEWKPSARKELRNLNKVTIIRILSAIEKLAENPSPHDSRKLRGSINTYRIRVGDYRVIYSVSPPALTIEIIRIGHRRDIYKRPSTLST